MYLGHLSAAFASKKWRADLPLWLLLLAPIWVDLCTGVLGLFGRRDLGGWTPHMLVGTVLISAAVGLAATWAHDSSAGLLCFALALSHWPGDFLTGRSPLWPGGPASGLHLYAGHRGLDFAIEAVLIAAGLALYRHSLPATRRASWPLWAMLVLQLAIQAFFDFGMSMGD